MAAAFMIVGSIVLSTTRYMRHKAWQTQCAAQMAGFAKGIEAYANDNQGKMPAVALSAGSPWWKVGAQGQENVSNTRHIWLLVKGGYANPNDFVCPGVRTEKLQPITDEQVMRLNDFPSRNYISYSLRLICDKSFTLSEPGRRLIISDMNPLFENLPADFSKPLKVELDDRLLNLNSINHQRKGQNVLFSDKTVKFVKTRRVDVGNDDIFTLRGKRFYEGYEIPACETDNFLAP
jgi:hypothetical protein